MNRKILFTALFSLVTLVAFSAKFKPAPVFLKGQTQINLIFNYSQVTYDGDSQEKYYGAKGAAWIEEWEGKRRAANAETFIKDMNEELEEANVHVGTFPEAQYTIIVDVLDCDFGAFSGPFSVPAKLKCTIRVVKTGTTETLASITLKKSQNPYSAVGTPVDFDRMYLAFGEMAEEVGETLVKIVKK